MDGLVGALRQGWRGGDRRQRLGNARAHILLSEGLRAGDHGAVQHHRDQGGGNTHSEYRCPAGPCLGTRKAPGPRPRGGLVRLILQVCHEAGRVPISLAARWRYAGNRPAENRHEQPSSQF